MASAAILVQPTRILGYTGGVSTFRYIRYPKWNFQIGSLVRLHRRDLWNRRSTSSLPRGF